jgi:hypothetical protein
LSSLGAAAWNQQQTEWPDPLYGPGFSASLGVSLSVCVFVPECVCVASYNAVTKTFTAAALPPPDSSGADATSANVSAVNRRQLSAVIEECE